jgi:integrase
MKPVPNLKIPKYSLHKARNVGCVKLNGRRHYLPGAFGSKESIDAYDQLISQWTAHGRQLPAEIEGVERKAGTTVAELIVAYLPYAATYYVKNGRTTRHYAAIRMALRVLVQLFPNVPVNEFGPLKMGVVRDAMIAKNWARRTVVDHIACIKALFRWGEQQELVAGGVCHALAFVQGLRKGRTRAREPEPVQEVHESVVKQTLPFLPTAVQSMVQVQLLTGMRPGELCQMRATDIKMEAEVWQYTPRHHKTEHHDKVRVICIGPRAQEILRPYLTGNPQAPLFGLVAEPGQVAGASWAESLGKLHRPDYPAGGNMGHWNSRRPGRCGRETATAFPRSGIIWGRWPIGRCRFSTGIRQRSISRPWPECWKMREIPGWVLLKELEAFLWDSQQAMLAAALETRRKKTRSRNKRQAIEALMGYLQDHQSRTDLPGNVIANRLGPDRR